MICMNANLIYILSCNNYCVHVFCFLRCASSRNNFKINTLITCIMIIHMKICYTGSLYTGTDIIYIEVAYLTFKAFIDRTAPLYLCELIEQQKSSTNTRTRLANDAFLLKLPPPSRNCSDTFFDRSFTYGAPYEWNKLDERVRRLSNFNLFKSEIKTVLFLRYFNS